MNILWATSEAFC